MSIDNNKSIPTGFASTAVKDLEAYDRLPPVVRAALQQAATNLAAEPVRRYLAQGMATPEFVAEAILRRMAPGGIQGERLPMSER